MTNITLAFFLILAIAVEFLAIFIGDKLGFSQVWAVGLGMMPALLIIFPVMRQWYGGKLRFPVWVLTVIAITAAGILVHRLTS